LAQSFFSIDDFTGQTYEFTLSTYASCSAPPIGHHRAHGGDGGAGDGRLAIIAFPIAYYAALCPGKWKALFYLGAMLPLWSSYLVKVYA
jgi:putative spermidine/putrescine transport system permease protein